MKLPIRSKGGGGFRPPWRFFFNNSWLLCYMAMILTEFQHLSIRHLHANFLGPIPFRGFDIGHYSKLPLKSLWNPYNGENIITPVRIILRIWNLQHNFVSSRRIILNNLNTWLIRFIDFVGFYPKIRKIRIFGQFLAIFHLIHVKTGRYVK